MPLDYLDIIPAPSVKDQVSPEEWEIRVELAALYRLAAKHGFVDLGGTHFSARVPGPDDHFLLNPFGMMFAEITASSLVNARRGAGRLTAPIPLSPCTSGACSDSADNGPLAPAQTGTWMPSSSVRLSAFRVTCASGAFPLTVVMPTRSVVRAASMMANASSCPGSQSRRTSGRGIRISREATTSGGQPEDACGGGRRSAHRSCRR